VKKKKTKPAPEIKSTADDLSAPDRAWAESIATLEGCPLHEAEKRVRRIRYDKPLEEKLHEVARELGPNVVITNIERTGPTMQDVNVYVVPAPVEAVRFLNGLPADKPSMLRNSQQEMANLKAQAHARAVMRRDVTTFELRHAFGPARTAISSGVLRDIVDPNWGKPS
jgi:hypothetical protein